MRLQSKKYLSTRVGNNVRPIQQAQKPPPPSQRILRPDYIGTQNDPPAPRLRRAGREEKGERGLDSLPEEDGINDCGKARMTIIKTHFLPYFNLVSNSKLVRTAPIMFQIIIGTSPSIMPYTSQRIIPNNIEVLKRTLISRALFSLYTRIICGTRAKVVNNPAKSPR